MTHRLPESLLDRHDPRALILVAGATPLLRPLQHQTWETFSVNWQTDVRIAFHWVREALIRPLGAGSRVIVVSEWRRAQRLSAERRVRRREGDPTVHRPLRAGRADRAGLDIRFTALFPRITPHTDLGRPAVSAYAARNGETEEQYLRPFGPALTPEIAGAAVLELVQTNSADLAPEYLLTGAGLQPLAS